MHPERSRSRPGSLWFGASAVLAGLNVGMLGVFGWRVLHGWMLLIFAGSLIGLSACATFYRRAIGRRPPRSAAPSDMGVRQPFSPDVPFAAALNQATTLQNEIDRAIGQTGYQKLRNQRKATYIKLATLLFSTAATIFLGLKGLEPEQTFKNIAFVFSASVTLLTALEPFFNFRSFWVEHEIAQGHFIGLSADLAFYLAGNPQPDANKLDEFHKTYNEIWAGLNAVWAENRRREKG